ncbi:MAG: DUF5106 domain-containing protein, partial [Muribaculaceae bacterium]|nr:DUF5106 domain-containing protein [Muribaculaceae bacterium]
NNLKRLLSLIVFSTGMALVSPAQHLIEIQPLFEYPVAPEELPTMYDKSNYIVEHFWDSFDLKSKTAVDQNALNHAFKVYATAMRFADREKTLNANQKLLNNLVKNPVLLLQFTKAAEETLYGPRAEFWIDEIYLQFLKGVTSNKKIAQNRRLKYDKQMKVIKETAEGNVAPVFHFKDRNGKDAFYRPMSTPTLIIFGDPWNTDWRLDRLKMESNLNLIQALDKGKVNILFIYPGDKEGWENQVSNYSEKWNVGKGEKLEEIYDLRITPAIYVISSEGKILEKNVPLSVAVSSLLDKVTN